jgi:hypothetical protein
MVRTTIAIGRIAMPRQHHRSTHLRGALHDSVEVFYFEPEQHTIPIRGISAIADRTVMMFDVKAVQLQDELAIPDQLLIVPAAVRPAAAQQALIPPAAGFNIRDTDERLGSHGSKPNRAPALASTYQATLEAVSLTHLYCTTSVRFTTLTNPALLPETAIV